MILIEVFLCEFLYFWWFRWGRNCGKIRSIRANGPQRRHQQSWRHYSTLTVVQLLLLVAYWIVAWRNFEFRSFAPSPVRDGIKCVNEIFDRLIVQHLSFDYRNWLRDLAFCRVTESGAYKSRKKVVQFGVVCNRRLFVDRLDVQMSKFNR